MTILDDRRQGRCSGRLERHPAVYPTAIRRERAVAVDRAPVGVRRVPARRAPARPAIAPLAYRGQGVGVSHAPHDIRRPVSTAATVTVAGLAALITVWLGLLAHFSGSASAAPAEVPARLAVVRVQAGETLQQLAGRLVPDAPVAQVVDRIRDLNKLESPALDAGQTLIAPLG